MRSGRLQRPSAEIALSELVLNSTRPDPLLAFDEVHEAGRNPRTPLLRQIGSFESRVSAWRSSGIFLRRVGRCGQTAPDGVLALTS